LDPAVRDKVVTSLFEEYIGDQESFSSTLYLSWEDARKMQSAGMIIGGHSHQHKPLASLNSGELSLDLNTCRRLLAENLSHQVLWPFCYPYGKQSSFNGAASGRLKELGFSCSFSTEVGSNLPGADLFALRRHDCKDIPAQ
jgi:peptidoglycan/xylan/chitin deacetylase (PgdA/CDA1 family)